jgi:hypothetical protein
MTECSFGDMAIWIYGGCIFCGLFGLLTGYVIRGPR